MRKYGQRADDCRKNLQRLWEIAREGVFKQRSSTKVKVPGPGAYETYFKTELLTLSTGASGQKGYSFSRDMRTFDRAARDELRNAIKQKEDDYVKNYAEM